MTNGLTYGWLKHAYVCRDILIRRWWGNPMIDLTTIIIERLEGITVMLFSIALILVFKR